MFSFMEHTAHSAETRSAILAIVRAASARQKLSTISSILWDMNLVDNIEGRRIVRGALSYLRAQDLVALRSSDNETTYTAR